VRPFGGRMTATPLPGGPKHGRRVA
jgi:hypothetical protein